MKSFSAITRIISVTVILLIISMSPSGLSAATSRKVVPPDFAYPADVAKAAGLSLDSVLSASSPDSQTALRSLIDYVTAKMLISNDNLNSVYEDMTVTEARLADPVGRALVGLIQADILSKYYDQNSSVLDRRNVASGPSPADISLWSGDQLRSRIRELIESILEASGALKACPIGNYSQIISADELTRIYYPTVYDFVGVKAMDILSSTSRMSDNGNSRLKASILDSLLAFHKSDPAPFINYTLMGSDDISFGKRMDLYRRFISSDFSGQILTDRIYGLNESEKAEYAAALRSNISRFPSFWGINNLKNHLAELTTASVYADADPAHPIPGREFNVHLNIANANECEVKFYPIGSTDRRNIDFKNIPAGSHPITVNFTTDKIAPFKIDTIVHAVLPSAGCYAMVVCEKGKQLPSGYSATVIEASALYGVEISGNMDGASQLVAVNAQSGAPASKVDVTFNYSQWKNGRSSNHTLAVGTTDKEGIVEVSPATEGQWGNFILSSGSDRVTFQGNLPGKARQSATKSYRLSGYTDRAIYRPGDQVRFAFLVSESEKDTHRLLPAGHEITITMSDANGQSVDTLRLSADEFGRVAGAMAIPSSGLTGSFSLMATVSEGDRIAGRGYAGFTVSDYKLPTFKVEINSVKRDYPAKGEVTLSGSVRDFTGFPIGGAAITVKLSTAPRLRWWWGSPDVTICALDTVADPEGNFSVTFGADYLSRGHDFCATFDATSAAGETRSATRYFTTGKPYLITYSTPENIDASQPVNLNLKVLDDEYKACTDLPMTFTLTSKEGKPAVHGSFLSSDGSVDWSKVKEGRYLLEIATADTALASPESSEIVIYRPSDKKVAVDVPLWVPQTSAKFENGKVRILYGVGSGKSPIYVFKQAKGYSRHEIIDAGAGYHYLEFDNPVPDEEELALTMFTVRDGRMYPYEINLTNPAASEAINVSVESFRDRLVPGSDETWIFKVKSAQGRGLRSALLLDVYNSALAELAPFTYRQPFFPRKSSPYISMSYDASTPSASWYASRDNRLPVERLLQPEFIDYGQNFGFMHIFRTENMVMKMAAPAMMARTTAAGMSMADGAELEEEAVAEDSAVEASLEENGVSESAPPTENDYRPSELPVMMFRPLLTTEADGTCMLSFTVPNANASWEMLLVAYTDRLQSAATSRSFVTSKPVMVTSNLPRFLREGDTALLPATVKNNTDSTSIVDVTVELFNLTNGKVYSTVNRKLPLSPMASDTVGITLNTEQDMNMIGYRVRAVSGRYSDGEQAAIPVLPSVEPVIESQTFFLSPEDTVYSVDVPTLAESTASTLLFCDNPRWWVVSALPGLRKNAGTDANSAAAGIFSAGVATRIISDYPAVGNALKEWLANPSDSMLVSMLTKNPELKITLLSATPWVSAAESDTERMTRLALLFDKKEVESSITSATELLSKLHADGGGWMWYSAASKPSSWVTLNVLGMMGDLRSMGFKPSKKLDGMIQSSLTWLDGEMVKSAAKSTSAAGYVNYAFIRVMFPDIAPSTQATALLARVKEDLVANWKKLSIDEKSVAAIILHEGGYPRVARQILESLRQYSRKTAEKGMWFPSLNDTKPWWPMTKNIVTAQALKAFATVDPGCKDAEYLAQWLVMQKEAQNWGSAVATTQVIAALLDAYRMPLQPAGTVEVTLGDENITPARIDRLTGDFSMSLTPYSPSGKTLKIIRTGGTQASGALITTGKADPRNVKSSSCEALSIEKSLQRRVVTPEGFRWEEATSLATGDRVQVTLLIRATRDLQYVTVTDNRAAAFEPVDQLPGYVVSEGVYFYRENRDAVTNLFIDYLPAGTYLLTYELNVNTAGSFTSGLATAQSQYSPAITAHSSGTMYEIR